MNKIKLLGLVGLVGAFIVTQAFAIEDGKYNCAIVAVSLNNLTKKLPEKEWQKVTFVKKGQKLTDESGAVFSYLLTSKNVDVYKNKDFMIGLPADNVGSDVFNMNFKANNKDIIYDGKCYKVNKDK